MKLRELRLNMGLSPNDLGRLSGVSGKTVLNAERGMVPLPRNQFAIAEVLGTTPVELFGTGERSRAVV